LDQQELTAFHEAMANANVSALWEQEIWARPPLEPPEIWRWEQMDPLIDGAARATTTEISERRVLILNNPAYADLDREGIGFNLSVTFQILLPGELARPHRHSLNALRFVIESEGALTTVNGKRCPMERGDMIITPAWTWHAHSHEGTGRAVWVDALDVGIQRHLDTGVIEPGPPPSLPEPLPDTAFAAPGFQPMTALDDNPYSPMFRYPWGQAQAALDALPAEADGSRKLRYTNPVTGDAAMPAVDCYLLGLARASETRPYRTNSNAVSVVVEGEGTSTIGDDSLTWGRNDVFTLPHGHWITHRAVSDDARLFQITDRGVLGRLGLLHDESRDGNTPGAET
jgi:gentisate 1,2-dioxygenase